MQVLQNTATLVQRSVINAFENIGSFSLDQLDQNVIQPLLDKTYDQYDTSMSVITKNAPFMASLYMPWVKTASTMIDATIEKYPVPEHKMLVYSFITALLSLLVVYLLCAILFKGISWIMGWEFKGTGVNILDVSAFDPGQRLEIPNDDWEVRAKAWFCLHDGDINFIRMIFDRSGIGPNTFFPPGIARFPPDLSLDGARIEAHEVIYSCIDKLLVKNNITPQDIDVLVVNCSLHNTTPSTCAMIMNHYNMRQDTIVYNLGGMGCSASPIAINAASLLLKEVKNKKHPLAVVVSMENITQNAYFGREKASMLANVLFRIGGAAILLTLDNKAVLNRPAPIASIDYLNHLHTAANVDAYSCVFQDIDKEKKNGVRLDKSLMTVAATAITHNLTVIGPKILPLSAKLDYVARLLLQKIDTQYKPMILRLLGRKVPPQGRPALVVPNFRAAIQHFAMHAGGRAVLDAVKDSLQLTEADLKPSRDVLWKQGNTSSSSIWYEFLKINENRKPKKGERILSIAVGSGFKCNLLVLRKL